MLWHFKQGYCVWENQWSFNIRPFNYWNNAVNGMMLFYGGASAYKTRTKIWLHYHDMWSNVYWMRVCISRAEFAFVVGQGGIRQWEDYAIVLVISPLLDPRLMVSQITFVVESSLNNWLCKTEATVLWTPDGMAVNCRLKTVFALTLMPNIFGLRIVSIVDTHFAHTYHLQYPCVPPVVHVPQVEKHCCRRLFQILLVSPTGREGKGCTATPPILLHALRSLLFISCLMELHYS